MNIAVSIPQPKCAYTLKQLKQLLIAYAQLTNREPYGLCAANHLHQLQSIGQSCPLLIALYTQEDVLVKYIKKHKVLGGYFDKRPKEIESPAAIRAAQNFKLARAKKAKENNRYLSNAEVEKFDLFFSQSGANIRDFAALFGYSAAWFSQLLLCRFAPNKGLVLRLMCLLDSEIQEFAETGSCRTLRKEVCSGKRALTDNEASVLKQYGTKHGLAKLSVKAGFGQNYLHNVVKNNSTMQADHISLVINLIKQNEATA